MKMRPGDTQSVIAVDMAIHHLKEARDWLKAADAPKTLARVRSALTSAGGAARHVQHRARRAR